MKRKPVARPKKKIKKVGKKQSPQKEQRQGADHSLESKRLRRIQGQVEGVGRMIEQRRYCPEILQQLKATRAALQSLEISMTERHLRHCVMQAFATKDFVSVTQKIEEIVSMMK